MEIMRCEDSRWLCILKNKAYALSVSANCDNVRRKKSILHNILHNILKIKKIKRLIHGSEATGGVFAGDRVTNQFTELLIISHIVR